MTRNRPLNCLKKSARRYRLSQKIIRTRFNAPHRGRNIGIAGEEYNWQYRSEFAQAILDFRAAQSRYPHVEQDAAKHAIARQAVQQMRSRSVGRDLVTGVSQTTFNSRSERSIVIDYVHKFRQGCPQRVTIILPWGASYHTLHNVKRKPRRTGVSVPQLRRPNWREPTIHWLTITRLTTGLIISPSALRRVREAGGCGGGTRRHVIAAQDRPSNEGRMKIRLLMHAVSTDHVVD